jgi:flagellar protein FliO/FliZ
MISAYLLKLAFTLPLILMLTWGSLWALRKLQGRMASAPARPTLAVVDAIGMGATGRIAVVEFDERRFLVSVTKTGMTLIGEERPRMPFADLVTTTINQGPMEPPASVLVRTSAPEPSARPVAAVPDALPIPTSRPGRSPALSSMLARAQRNQARRGSMTWAAVR